MPDRTIKRDRRRIRSWMVRHGITGTSVAKATGVSNALVCSTIGGTRNNRKVLKHLISLGCPTKPLSLPTDLLIASATSQELVSQTA